MYEWRALDGLMLSTQIEFVAILQDKMEHLLFYIIKYYWVIIVGANYMDEIKFKSGTNELGFPPTPEPEIRDIGFDFCIIKDISDLIEIFIKKIKHI